MEIEGLLNNQEGGRNVQFVKDAYGELACAGDHERHNCFFFKKSMKFVNLIHANPNDSHCYSVNSNLPH